MTYEWRKYTPLNTGIYPDGISNNDIVAFEVQDDVPGGGIFVRFDPARFFGWNESHFDGDKLLRFRLATKEDDLRPCDVCNSVMYRESTIEDYIRWECLQDAKHHDLENFSDVDDEGWVWLKSFFRLKMEQE